MAELHYKAAIARAQSLIDRAVDEGLQGTLVELVARVVPRTPVATGAAKYHWFIRGVPDESFDKANTDTSGAAAIARARGDAASISAGATVWVLNSAPYSPLLEAGSSTQAPNGFLGITQAEAVPIFERAMRRAFEGRGVRK